MMPIEIGFPIIMGIVGVFVCLAELALIGLYVLLMKLEDYITTRRRGLRND